MSFTPKPEEARAILEAHPDLYLWLDSNGKIFKSYTVNPSTLLPFPEDLLGKSILKILPSRSVRKLSEALQTVRSRKVLTVVEFETDGNRGPKHFEVRLVPFSDLEYLAILRDITEQDRAGKNLRQNEARLQAILNSEPECVKVVRIDGTLEDMNPAGLRMIQAESLEQVRGQPVVNLVHPDDRNEFLELHRAVCQGESGMLRFRTIGLLGFQRWMETHSVPLRDADGKIVSVLSVTRDITERRRVEDALLESEERYRSLVTQSSEGIYVLDPYTRKIQEANPVFLEMLGYSEEEIQHLSLYDISAENPASVDYNIQTVLHSGQIFISHTQYRHKNGLILDVEAHATLISYGDAQVVLVNVTDLSERKRSEMLQSALYRIAEQTAATQDLQDFYRAVHGIVAELMNTKNFFIALHDPEKDVLTYPYFCDEVDPQPPSGQREKSLSAYVIRTGTPLLATQKIFDELVREGEVEELGSACVDWIGVPMKLGDRTIGVLVVQSYREDVRLGDKDKEVLMFVSQHIASALERKRAEETIRHHAYHDVLTLLPNRIFFRDRFSQAMSRAQREEEMLAMLFLDLDRFKTINDTLGHAMGDRLLQSVAERLSNSLREKDTIARLGGDEFMILISGIHHAEDAARVAEKILSVFREPFVVEGQDLHITTSIGISLYPRDGQDAEALFKHSDIALYKAKDRGRNRYEIYAASMNVQAQARLMMENGLRRALDQRDFLLMYQPQIHVNTGALAGMEALIRWIDPRGVMINPTEFIPICEEAGLIVPVGEWVLQTACEQNKKWQETGFPMLPLAVNISAGQFQQQNIVESVIRILKDTDYDPRYLQLEITESVVMQSPELATEVLKEFQIRGIQICVDDFGTGYSSFNYLKRFPINTLKIDQSFVADCIADSDNGAIVSAIISMAHSLKKKVIAEGVESQEQLEFLRSKGCDIAQGFLFSKPISPLEFEQYIGEHPVPPFMER